MKSKSLTIRLSERRKNKLCLYAAQKDKTITALIEDWIDSLKLTEEVGSRQGGKGRKVDRGAEH